MMARMHLSVLLITATIAIAVVVGFRQANRFWWSEPADDATSVAVAVEPGSTLSSVTPLLVQNDIVNSFWFRVYAKLSGSEDIRPGEYGFSRGMNYATILGLLHYGNVNDIAVTFPEGFTIVQMGERVVANFPNITAEEWKVATGQFSAQESHPFVIAAEKPDDIDLEGYLFPDTYRFLTDATAEDIVQEMIDTMETKYDTAMPDDRFGIAGNLMLTPHEYLTLASIVEKEVRLPDTMAMVADIFLKRLNIGMALQSDATVNYVTGGDDPSVSLADTDIESLYNTYKYPGLPPGPISNPGANALTAVASPTANAYYYFLTTDDGEVHYAVTHDQHVANKARYLR